MEQMLIDTDAAAQLLDISPRLLRNLVAHSAIPVIRVGRLVRFSPFALQEWIAARTTWPAEPVTGAGAPDV